MTETPDVPLAAEAVAASLPAPCSVASEVTTLMLEKKLEELKLSDRKHVIIPNHLQVSESERHGLSFGSFDPNFELNMGFANGPAKDRIDTPVSDSSQETEETTEQPSLRLETLVLLLFFFSLQFYIHMCCSTYVVLFVYFRS